MGLEEIEKIAKSTNLIYLSVGGGEPFLRKDLAKVVELFYKHSGILYCNIVTNGHYTKKVEKVISEILENCPRLKLKVQISLDDFEEAHDEYRKVPGIFSNAMETMAYLTELREKNPQLTLDIATCMTRSNKDHIKELHDDMRNRCEFDSYQILFPRGDAEVEEEKEVESKEYLDALKHVDQHDFTVNHNPILSAVNRVARAGIFEFLDHDGHPWDCLAGRKFISITEKGVLQACEVLPQMYPDMDSDLANLKNFDFDVAAALDASKAKQVVEFIKDSKCRCSFECAANCNVVFSKTRAIKVMETAVRGGYR
jgi:MoaA/NifB/PqqE/SkfB family radical SAM enzyme